jgi:hypothetical protein
MASAMLVAAADAPEPLLGPVAADRLAELGVATISLLRDPSGVAVVLEGWAFDPARIDEAVRAVFPDAAGDVRVLHEIERVVVAPAAAGRSA